MPINTQRLFEKRSEIRSAPSTSLQSRTAPPLDLRILAFMLVVAVVQLFSFKRPFS